MATLRPFWDNVTSWWDIRTLPNRMLLHFEQFRRDLSGQMRRIAAFLDIAIDKPRFPSMVEHCSFAWMKANATRSTPLGGTFWEGGAEVFINRGTNGRWRDVVSADDNKRYAGLARERLGPECAAWLVTGEPVLNY
jgi:aryl sulfotransferase